MKLFSVFVECTTVLIVDVPSRSLHRSRLCLDGVRMGGSGVGWAAAMIMVVAVVVDVQWQSSCDVFVLRCCFICVAQIESRIGG